MPRKGKNNNLIPGGHKLTVDELSKGGKLSGEARRKKKALREEMEELLSLPLTNPKMIQNLVSMGVPAKKDSTFQTLISASMIYQAARGNVQAFKALSDIITLDEDEKKNEAESGAVVNIVIEDTSGERNDEGK